jgi:hypothetical protein
LAPEVKAIVEREKGVLVLGRSSAERRGRWIGGYERIGAVVQLQFSQLSETEAGLVQPVSGRLIACAE